MPAVTALFGDQIGLASAFVQELAGSAVERGLIGPREVPRLWERHLLNCAAVAELVPEGRSVGDVGSGAGLPGLVLAIARPDLRITLIEPLQRRVTWLCDVVERLALRDSVTVLRTRAEDSPQRDFDVVTARAVAPLDVLAGWCLPLVRSGGVMLALKGQSAADELTRAEPTLRRLGARGWEVCRCGEGVLTVPTTVIKVRAGTRPVGRRRR
jgi:16S rRNA (guanine527-N7)-methyltransferase